MLLDWHIKEYKCSKICTTSGFVGTRGFVAVQASARALSAIESIALKYSVLSMLPICEIEIGMFISFIINCIQPTRARIVVISLKLFTPKSFATFTYFSTHFGYSF